MPKSPAKSEYIVLQSHNTPAVDLAGTAVAAAIHKAHPNKKLIVTTNFPEIWLHNPNVWRVYRLGQTPYFFEDFVEGRETQMFIHDPTKSSDYVNSKKHLIEVWCDICKVPYNSELPSLHFTQRESEVAMRMTEPTSLTPELAVDVDERRMLHEVVSKLPGDQRQVVEMRLAGMTGAEIATALGRGLSSVKVLQLRAIPRLRMLLGVGNGAKERER